MLKLCDYYVLSFRFVVYFTLQILEKSEKTVSKIVDRVNNYIVDNQMINTGDRIVLGLSGGADSVCLLLLLLDLAGRLGYASEDIFAVHINHMIRGQEADEDE